MSIKDKPLKKIHSDSRITIDAIHNNLIDNYKNDLNKFKNMLKNEKNEKEQKNIKNEINKIQDSINSKANKEFLFGRNEPIQQHYHKWVDKLSSKQTI